MKRWLTVGLAMAVMSGCSQQQDLLPVSGEIVNSFVANIADSQGKALGTAELTETNTGVRIHLKLSGLEKGEKAIHFHETGKCEAPDFTSSGSHVNPTKRQHGFDNPKGYHAGDLPNLKVDANGEVDLEITTPLLTLEKGMENSLLDEDGSAIVIHEKADDYVTDPAGNSGKRIACGVIK